MKEEQLDEFVERGMQGPLETKKDERDVYLTTIRERVILVLTKQQVMANKAYPGLQHAIKEYANCHLYLDGEIDYKHLSKYIKIANEAHVPFTIVDDLGEPSVYGLVLATEDEAIDLADVNVTDEQFNRS